MVLVPNDTSFLPEQKQLNTIIIQDESLQDREQPYGLVHLSDCRLHLLLYNRANGKFLGLPGIYHHSLQV